MTEEKIETIEITEETAGERIDRILAEFRKKANADFVLASAASVHHPVYQTNCTNLLSHIFSKKEVYQTIANGSVGRDI